MNKKIALCLSTLILFGASSVCAEAEVAQATKTIDIKIPKVPEVPKVTAVVPVVNVIVEGKSTQPTKVTSEVEAEVKDERHGYEKAMIFSKRVPPGYNKNQSSESAKKAAVGEIENGRVAAYLHTKLMSAKEVQANLEKAGFEVIAIHKLDKKGTATSIVFTNHAMKTAAAKKTRGFASTLRAVIDTKNSLTSISNPIYVMRAFMQKEYNEKLAASTLSSIRRAFEGLENSQEMVKFRILERYHFMENMPYYQDMITISSAKNDILMKKAKKSKKIVYEHKLDNGSYMMGVQLGKRTSKFIKKTGYTNAGLLPYPVLIEDGTAKILDPKFYISVMYPMLKMSQFMTIATVPGAIEKDCDKIFR